MVTGVTVKLSGAGVVMSDGRATDQLQFLSVQPDISVHGDVLVSVSDASLALSVFAWLAGLPGSG